MTPLALALVLAAAICHATWNLVAKKAGGGSHFVLMGSLQVAVVWLPVVAWIGVREVVHLGVAEWLFLAASALVHVLYFRTLLHGYAVKIMLISPIPVDYGGKLLRTRSCCHSRCATGPGSCRLGARSGAQRWWYPSWGRPAT